MRKKDDITTKNVAVNIQRLRSIKFPGHGGQKEAAKAFGVALQMWNAWEKGRVFPSDSYQRKIADFFKVNVEELRGGEVDEAGDLRAEQLEPQQDASAIRIQDLTRENETLTIQLTAAREVLTATTLALNEAQKRADAAEAMVRRLTESPQYSAMPEVSEVIPDAKLGPEVLQREAGVRKKGTKPVGQ